MRKFSRKLLWQGKFIRVIGKGFSNKNGTRGIWECVELSRTKNIVMIFALTKKKEVILGRQFRFPLEKDIVELPVGLADKSGESLVGAARRELLEETGYKAKKFIFVSRGYFNQGLTNSEIFFYFAPEATFFGFDGVSSDDSEEIKVVRVPLKKLADFCLKKHKNFVVDLKILNALKILEEKKLIA
ncbi:MAG: NUDIX hydrolase [Patescibacteria group bacterium]|nr:NUDIX hydrolase [Patescibacteria group bacterium]MDD5294461.1 NUDIX hydrolase [Patescibacteria group bacterium]MDD5554372.1 NUDIX hydrolase [Patescibacteria group bacterium]